MQFFQIYGRLGNQLFQFSHIYTIMQNNTNDKYSICFDNDILDINYSALHNPPSYIMNGNDGLFLGWNESEYFFDRDLIKNVFTIPKDVKDMYVNKYGKLDNSLLISVRRGDFVSLKDIFLCCNAKYYETAYDILTKDGKKYDKIFITSDDIEWCKENIHIDGNIIYLEDEHPLYIIFMCYFLKDFIISTSTFSWWCAWMGERNGGKIICPKMKYLKGFEKENQIYFPDRWEKIQNMEGLYEV